jgi:TnpA family transposase
MGNGTTAVCAKMLYRHYLGFEINPELKTIHQHNLSQVELGEEYQPYSSQTPELAEILDKYPNLKAVLKDPKIVAKINPKYQEEWRSSEI